MPALSSASCPEQLLLIGRRVDLQQIPLVAAAVEADAPLGITDELELSRLQLEVVHVELPVHLTAVEEKLMGGDGKQGAGQLPHALDVEILQVLRCQDQGGIALSHPLEAVADVLDGGQVGQPEVELVQGGHGVAFW